MAGDVPLLTGGTEARAQGVVRPGGRQPGIGRSQRLKHAVKVAVAYGLYYAGVLHLLKRVVLRRKAVVLMYHRVLDERQRGASGSHPGIIVSCETFAKHLAVLKRSFVVLSADEFAARVDQRVPFPDSACLITFDDGWMDNFVNALPALRTHGLPALIFLPVNYIGQQRLFWQESLTHLLSRVVAMVRTDPDARSRFELMLDEVGLGPILDTTAADPRPSISEAIGALKAVDTMRVQRLIAELGAALDVQIERLSQVDRFIDWQQAAQMSSQRIDFGGHGAEHCLLTNVTPAEASAEISRSKQVIDASLAQQTATFSYPNGSWNPTVAAAVRRAGYRFAFTTEPGYVSCEDEPLALRRINVHEDATSSVPMFLARLVGLF